MADEKNPLTNPAENLPGTKMQGSGEDNKYTHTSKAEEEAGEGGQQEEQGQQGQQSPPQPQQ